MDRTHLHFDQQNVKNLVDQHQHQESVRIRFLNFLIESNQQQNQYYQLVEDYICPHFEDYQNQIAQLLKKLDPNKLLVQD